MQGRLREESCISFPPAKRNILLRSKKPILCSRIALHAPSRISPKRFLPTDIFSPLYCPCLDDADMNLPAFFQSAGSSLVYGRIYVSVAKNQKSWVGVHCLAGLCDLVRFLCLSDTDFYHLENEVQ